MDSTRVTDIPGLNFCWKVGENYLAGQPPIDSFEKIKEMGVERVFNLRNRGEDDFSAEEQKCKELGMEYYHIPIIVDGSLNAANCEKLSQLIKDNKNNFVHCVSANRVNGWFITHLTKYENMDFEDAVDLASMSGLTNPSFIEQAQLVLDI